MIVPGMFVCSSFLINVCIFIVSKALLISSATVIVRAGGAIWLNPFATVLFSLCMAVTVVLYFIPVLHGCVWYVCCYVWKKALLQCPVPLSVFLLGFGIGTMLANLHV